MDKFWLIYYSGEWQCSDHSYTEFEARKEAERLISEGRATQVVITKQVNVAKRSIEWDTPKAGK